MSAIARSAGKKLFERHLQNYEPKDPLYETYTDNKGRQRRRKVCGAHGSLTDYGTHFRARDAIAGHTPWPVDARCQNLEVRAETGALS